MRFPQHRRSDVLIKRRAINQKALAKTLMLLRFHKQLVLKKAFLNPLSRVAIARQPQPWTSQRSRSTAGKGMPRYTLAATALQIPPAQSPTTQVVNGP